ncbi:MAG: DUF1653 domain-containing protein [Candidatus Nanoarchaeia archaeon]|nr:DUF1653 domain-containing protein [Candidatus Nanoarchaeia archaeon]
MTKELVPGGMYEHFKGNLYLAIDKGNTKDAHLSERPLIARYCEDDSIEVRLFVGVDGFAIEGNIPEGEYVVYQQLYDAEKYKKYTRWIRPLEDFLSTKIVDSKEVERFKYVGHYNQPGTGCS